MEYCFMMLMFSAFLWFMVFKMDKSDKHSDEYHRGYMKAIEDLKKKNDKD